VELPETGAVNRVTVDGRELAVESVRLDNGTAELLLDGRPLVAGITEDSGGCRLQINGREITAEVWDERREAIQKLAGAAARKKGSAGELHAPMPGLVVKLEVSVGDRVQRGQGVVIVEAMKMENEIAAPTGGVVRLIKVSAGRAVEKGELMMVIE